MKTPESATDNNDGRKTPEETKKWLEYCYSAKPCADCKYDERDFPHCVRRLLKDAIDGYEQLESRLAQVERERDAAVNDLKLVRCCGTCINNEGGCTTECYIVSGALTGWQWRGVCPENTKVKHIPENCHNYTIRAYDGMGCCLGTKEIDPCKGENCENWKPKEE